MQTARQVAGRHPRLNKAQAAAVHAMVYEGANQQAAAAAAGFSFQRLSQLMRQPHFKQALEAERDVLISAARASNVLAAIKIRDDTEAAGGARVAAARLIEELSEPQSSAGAVAPPSPGYVIVIPQQSPAAALPWPSAPSGPMIEVQAVRDVQSHDDEA